MSNTVRFGRSSELLEVGWLTRSGYTKSRFMSKVKKWGGCWLWQARLDRDGYGRFSLNGKPRAAHRVAFEAIVGPIPEGLTVDHLCRVRSCVNPDHMELVTHKVNVNRGLRKLSGEEIVRKSSTGILANLYIPDSEGVPRLTWCGRGDLNPHRHYSHCIKSTL